MQRIRRYPSRLRRHHHARASTRDRPAQVLVLVKAVVHDRLAARRVQHSRPESDQPARRDGEFHVAHVVLRVHLHHLAPATAHQLDHRTRRRRRHVYHQVLHRLRLLPAQFAIDHLRLAHRQLEPLPSHRLDQHAQVQQAPPRHPERVLLRHLLHAKGHVRVQLLHQPVPHVTRRQKLPLATRKRRVVHAEDHRQGRLVHRDDRQRVRIVRVGHRVADPDLRNPRNRHDVPGSHVGRPNAAESDV